MIIILLINVLILISVFYVLLMIYVTVDPFIEKNLENAIINRMMVWEKIIIGLNILALVIRFLIGNVTVESIRPYEIFIIMWIIGIAITIKKREDVAD